MQEILAWIMAAAMTLSMFFAGFTYKKESQTKRQEKQNLNLAGGMISKYCEWENGAITVDYEEYTEKVRNLLPEQIFYGIVVSSPGKIYSYSVNHFYEEKNYETGSAIDTDRMAFEINVMAARLVQNATGEEKNLGIEIPRSVDFSGNTRRSSFFNGLSPDETCVFIITRGVKSFQVAGFSLQSS